MRRHAMANGILKVATFLFYIFKGNDHTYSRKYIWLWFRMLEQNSDGTWGPLVRFYVTSV